MSGFKFKINKGFSLLELSVTLAVIALIAAVILIGKDLIEAAKAREFVVSLEKYSTAKNVFKEKYGYLPGDFPNAEEYFSLPKIANGESAFRLENGNGNNKLDLAAVNSFSAEASGDALFFWNHLEAAKLIDGSYTKNYYDLDPRIAFPEFGEAGLMPVTIYSDYDVFSGFDRFNGKEVFLLGFDNSGAITSIDQTYGSVYTQPAITPAFAYNVDQKIDDGLPFSGKVDGGYTFDFVGGASYPADGTEIDFNTGSKLENLSNPYDKLGIEIKEIIEYETVSFKTTNKLLHLVSDPCLDPIYAANNPLECGGGPPGDPCLDPIYAANNPLECGGGGGIPPHCFDPLIASIDPLCQSFPPYCLVDPLVAASDPICQQVPPYCEDPVVASTDPICEGTGGGHGSSTSGGSSSSGGGNTESKSFNCVDSGSQTYNLRSSGNECMLIIDFDF